MNDYKESFRASFRASFEAGIRQRALADATRRVARFLESRGTEEVSLSSVEEIAAFIVDLEDWKRRRAAEI